MTVYPPPPFPLEGVTKVEPLRGGVRVAGYCPPCGGPAQG